MVDRVIKGKFKILRKLGQGGMGAVYLAEQLGIGHRVALKFLKSEFSTDAEIARRFLNEAKSYARVAHPNAVAHHDFGQDDDGNLFIAMEYCEGVDLTKVIAEQKRLPVADAVDIILQVADVLANAHTKGVVHRDLKPENIMLSEANSISETWTAALNSMKLSRPAWTRSSFPKAPSRMIVSTRDPEAVEARAAESGVPCRRLGKVGGSHLTLRCGGAQITRHPVSELLHAWLSLERTLSA